MEFAASIGDKLKELAKSAENVVTRRRERVARNNPIEILKRLQREAFADLMKLRDRQDKVEKMLTFYRTSKGSPFQEDGTRVRGEVDATGSLFVMDYVDQKHLDAISRAGIRTGIDARIIFETKVRQKDILEAEFVSSQSSHGDSGNFLGNTLSLAKVCYTANMTDWLSIAAIPMGARCIDMAVSANSSFEDKGLTNYSSFGPPLLCQNHGSAFGLAVKKSNVVASLAQFVVDLPNSFGNCFSTFGQIVCQLPRNSKLSLFGLHQVPKSRQLLSLGPLTMPLCILRRHKSSQNQTITNPSSPPVEPSTENLPAGSIAVMLESELDESTRVQGWVQMRNSNPRHLQWAISMTDFPEDEAGWGLSLGGSIQGPKSWDHFQVEAFLKFNVGKRLTLQPAILYLMDGNNQMPVLMCRSTWSL